MYCRDIGVSAECQLRFWCNLFILASILLFIALTYYEKKVVAYSTEIQVCLWYYILMQTNKFSEVAKNLIHIFFVIKKNTFKFFVIPLFIGVWVCFLALIENDRKSGTNWGSTTFSCLPFLKCLENIRQKCPLKNRSDFSWDKSVLLLDNKLNFQILTKYGTEVSFGGTEVSFGFCKKQKCPFAPSFWDKYLFAKKLLTNTTSLSK